MAIDMHASVATILVRLERIETRLVQSAKKYLTAEDVEAEYGIPQSTLSYYRSQSQGPVWLKPGKRVLYRREEVETWISRSQRKTLNRT